MRLVRSQVIAVQRQDYVAAARAMGASNLRILTRHILPERGRAGARLRDDHRRRAHRGRGDADLPRRRTAAAGDLVGAADQRRARRLLRTAPHLVLFPSMFLSLTVLAFIMLGDAAARRPRPEAAFMSTQHAVHHRRSGAGRADDPRHRRRCSRSTTCTWSSAPATASSTPSTASATPSTGARRSRSSASPARASRVTAQAIMGILDTPPGGHHRRRDPVPRAATCSTHVGGGAAADPRPAASR